jgi:hypothetical protein
LPTPTPEALIETLTHAIAIADQLAGDWALVQYDSTYPGGRNPDRGTRVHPRPPADDPDAVPGAKWDSGQGAQNGKDACANAARLVVAAHRLAGQAAAALANVEPRELTARPARESSGFRRQVFGVAGRLRWLQAHEVGRSPGDVRRLAHEAAVQLIEAHAAVKGLMRDFEAVRELPAERRCFNCQRPVVYVRTMECEACSRWRRRMEARIRQGLPVEHRLRPVPRYEEAHRARQRRQDRLAPGQLDIEGPLPGGTYREGEWVPAFDWTAPTGGTVPMTEQFRADVEQFKADVESVREQNRKRKEAS